MYRYSLFVASGVRGPGTSFMIWSLLIQSRLATFHHSSWYGRTAWAGVCLFGSGGQPFSYRRAKWLTKPATKWTIGGGITTVLSGINLIAPIWRQPGWETLNALARIALGTVATISGYSLSHQAGGITSQATSRPLDHWIGMRQLMRMMMMRTGQIPQCRASPGAVLAMAMKMMTAMVWTTRRAVRKGPDYGWEERMGRGIATWLRTERWKGRGRGRGTVQEKVFQNKPQGEMISLVVLLCRCRRQCMRQTETERVN